ncbi:hypothetical protein [Curtobacterium sp. MCBA15_001]|uniref:hypothetical protein n=1 Tax=Curtobacterium sp. MCBA15_001 TaxID=1898731 RepID=UPI0011135A7D|nr:hypothetical protein [Curtobacterium sp. MCBA15_001]
MKLYDLSRVEKVEASPAWSEWTAKSTKRSLTAADAAQQRRRRAAEAEEAAAEKFLSEFGTPEVHVFFNGSHEQLIAYAVAEYNAARELQPWDRNYADAASSAEFLGRITTNYLRHSCTNYDALVRRCEGQPGGDEVYERVVDAVSDAMDEAFPELSKHVFRYQLGKQLAPSM